MIDPEFYDLVIDDFTSEIKKERDLYLPIIKVIEDYCTTYSKETEQRFPDTRIIISGSVGVSVLLKSPRSLEDYSTIYIQRRLSIMLTDFLTK
jgi:hypothetical protein